MSVGCHTLKHIIVSGNIHCRQFLNKLLINLLNAIDDSNIWQEKVKTIFNLCFSVKTFWSSPF